MLRRRIITLDITTDEGRPEDWDWHNLLNPGGSTGTEVKVVGVEKETVK